MCPMHYFCDYYSKYSFLTLRPMNLRHLEHLLALATMEQRMLILVDIDKLLSGADIGLVEPTLQ